MTETIPNILLRAKLTDAPDELLKNLEIIPRGELVSAIKAMPYAEFVETRYWQAVSITVKERAGRRCQICNSERFLEAHHRTYENHGCEHLFLEDLTCLCRRCHGIFHGTIQIQPTPVAAVETPGPKKISKRERRQLRANKILGVVGDYEKVVDSEMPPGEEIIITRELINKCRTIHGAFTNATLRAFGLHRPLITGWPERLVGKTVSRARFRECLKGRFIYNSGCLDFDATLKEFPS